jgi:membrane protein implicated in regulation of membrane protease activity
MDAIRQIIFSTQTNIGFLPVETELIILFVLAVVLLTLAWYSLRKLEEIGRRDGRLIERRR